MKSYMSAIKGMQQASINLTQSLHEVYELDWHGKEDVLTIGKDCDALWEDFHNKLVDSTLLNLDGYLQQFPDLKNRVAKRSRKLIDYDSARHHVETLQASGMKSDRKMMKAEDELRKAQRVFDELNVGLQDELPSLWDSRVGFYISTFKSVTSLEARFHREISTVCRQLYEVMTHLGEQHSDKMFTIQGAPSDSGPLRLARTPSPPEDESPPESPVASSNHMLRPVSPGPPRPKSPSQHKQGPPVPPPPKVTPSKEVAEEQIIDLFGGEFLPAPSPSQPNERPGESLLDLDFDAFQPDDSVSPIPQTAVPWDMWSAQPAQNQEAETGFVADWSADFGSMAAKEESAPSAEEAAAQESSEVPEEPAEGAAVQPAADPPLTSGGSPTQAEDAEVAEDKVSSVDSPTPLTCNPDPPKRSSSVGEEGGHEPCRGLRPQTNENARHMDTRSKSPDGSGSEYETAEEWVDGGQTSDRSAAAADRGSRVESHGCGSGPAVVEEASSELSAVGSDAEIHHCDGSHTELDNAGDQGDVGALVSDPFAETQGDVGALGSDPFAETQGDVGAHGSDPFAETQGDVGALDSDPFAETQGDVGAFDSDPFAETQGDVGAFDSDPFAETQGDVGAFDSDPFAETQGDVGALDSDPFAETQGDVGALGSDQFAETHGDVGAFDSDPFAETQGDVGTFDSDPFAETQGDVGAFDSDPFAETQGDVGAFDSDPFAETQGDVGAFDSDLFALTSGGSGAFNSDPFAESQGTTGAFDSDPFAQSPGGRAECGADPLADCAADAGSHSPGAWSATWQESSGVSGDVSDGSMNDLNVSRIQDLENISDEESNQRFGKLYTEESPAASTFVPDFGKMNEEEPAGDSEAPGAADEAPESVEIKEASTDEAPDRTATESPQEKKTAAVESPVSNAAEEKMTIPSVVIEPASSNEGDDDRDADIISPTTLSDSAESSDSKIKHMPASGGGTSLPEHFLYKVETMHDFEAANSDELELKRGDIVLVIPTASAEDQDAGWLTGIKADDWNNFGTSAPKGLFPENFTHRLE
ncbi:amphiphysin isoform X2 [Synchiropus splendidus]|nr:amphiphysin isoform X2 [Synchiropus splendidus]XP_053739057.1 amphiphysin isoform X2 [Synchiropus splendidus]